LLAVATAVFTGVQQKRILLKLKLAFATVVLMGGSAKTEPVKAKINRCNGTSFLVILM